MAYLSGGWIVIVSSSALWLLRSGFGDDTKGVNHWCRGHAGSLEAEPNLSRDATATCR